MASDDLTKAFKSGAIGRRAFVRGMVSLGMTFTAANLLADDAEAAPKKRKTHKDDVYGTIGSRIARKIIKSPILAPRLHRPLANPKHKQPRHG